MKELNLHKNIPQIHILTEALSSNTRLRLLRIISASEGLGHGELAKKLDTSSQSISYHINKLKDAGLVKEHKEKIDVYSKKVPELKINKIVIQL